MTSDEHEWVEYMDGKTLCKLCGVLKSKSREPKCRGRIHPDPKRYIRK